jgi:hypothetical protein
VGEDIRLEQRTLRGRVDVTLRAFVARPLAVLEFKAPGISVAGFIEQLLHLKLTNRLFIMDKSQCQSV